MDGIAKDDFVSMREERDATLKAPRLLHQSLQMNVRGGKLPKLTASGLRMIQMPIYTVKDGW